MPFTMKVDMPNLPPGEKVQVHGLGVIENGKTLRVTDEQAETFRQLNGAPQKVLAEDGKPTGAIVFEPGPSLAEANFPEGITVTAENAQTPATPKEESQ